MEFYPDNSKKIKYLPYKYILHFPNLTPETKPLYLEGISYLVGHSLITLFSVLRVMWLAYRKQCFAKTLVYCRPSTRPVRIPSSQTIGQILKIHQLEPSSRINANKKRRFAQRSLHSEITPTHLIVLPGKTIYC